jgi:signal transduction histidine kinase
VKLDQLRIQQVLINLLTNAIKFSKPHDVVIVKLTWSKIKPKGEKVNFSFSVIDSGMGISSEDQKNLF